MSRGGGQPNDFEDDEMDFEGDDMAPPEDYSGASFGDYGGGRKPPHQTPQSQHLHEQPKAAAGSSLSKVMARAGINARVSDPSSSSSSSSSGHASRSNRPGELAFGSGGGGGGAGGKDQQGGGGGNWRGPLPQVKSETISATREAYQLEQALRYHTVMKPRADSASPPEQSHILSHILSYFVHNGFSRSAEALFRSGSLSQPIGTAIRDGPYRDLPRLLGSATKATSELFDDDTPWESELLFRFAQSGSSGGGGGNLAPTSHPTHDFVILNEQSRAQLGTVEFLMTKLILEHSDTPYAARQRFEVNFTNVFLTTVFSFCTPDAFVAKCLKLFKAMQLHVSLLGEQTVVTGCRRLLIVLAAYVSSNRIDIGRNTLERLLSLSVSLLSHASSNPSPGSAEVAQAAQQLLAAIEELERAAASCGAFADLPGASQLRKSVSNAMHTFGVNSSAVVASGSVPGLSSGNGGATSAAGGGSSSSFYSQSGPEGAGGGGGVSQRWKAQPYLPFSTPQVDIERAGFRGDGPIMRLADVPENEVARQLTLMHMSLFQKIAPREFVSAAWVNPTLEPVAANLVRFVRQEELVAQWVASSIIIPHEPAERRAAYARMTRIMRLLFDMQNYSLASAFFQGLENASVRRMTRTVAGSLSDDEQASYDVVKAAMNPFTGSLKSIPQDLRTACVPLLAPFVSEACRLHDSQESVVSSTLDIPVRGPPGAGGAGAGGDNSSNSAPPGNFTNTTTSAAASAAAGGGKGEGGGGEDGDSSSNAANNKPQIRKIPTKVQLVNWSKMIALAKIMLKLSAFQSRPYAYDPDSVVQRLLQRLPLSRKDPDRLQQMSLEREPAASSVTGPLVSSQ